MSRRRALALAAGVGAVVFLVGSALARLSDDRRALEQRAAARAAAAAWSAAAGGGEGAWLDRSTLDRLTGAGYDYRLEGVGGGDGDRPRVIARSTVTALVDPVEVEVRRGTGTWTLEVAPRGGWAAGSRLGLHLLVAAIGAVAAAVFAHDLLRRPTRLVREIERARLDLADARSRLADEVARREQAEERLGNEAFRDALTGLPNRAFFLDRLERALARSRRRPSYRLAVALLDIDRFKTINDSLGHAAGDELLTAAARRLEAGVRPQDLVARVGGDEFAVLQFDIGNDAAAMSAAERLLASLAEPFAIGEREVFASASIGVSVSSSGYDRAEELLREAGIAMHQAKAQGRARAVRVDPGARDVAASILQLEQDLRRAVERGEFQLRYQPIVDLEDGRMAGMEALIRWLHPLEGEIAPGGFIDLAEETGLIVAIDRWALAEACRQARAWRDRLPPQIAFYVSVNLSGRDLRQPDLVDFVADTLRRTALPAGMLRLEVTESIVLANVGGTDDLVAALRGLGVPLMLDDFGTGYSSLAYLHRFQFEYLKIDRSFVQRLGGSGPDEGIVRAIVRLAAELGLKTIAEGVDQADQVARLRRLGCDFAQGYHLARPLEAGAVEDLLFTRRRWPVEATRRVG